MTRAGSIRADSACTSEVERLAREHHGGVFAYAYRLTGTASDAEDLVQQTFLLAMQHIDQLNSWDQARGWLFTIARNLFLKQRQRRAATEQGLTDEDEIPERTNAIPEWVDEEALHAALAKLDEPARTVLLMYFFEDLSYQQIADALQIPLGTVMSRLARAKERLKRELLPAMPRPSVGTPHIAVQLPSETLGLWLLLSTWLST